MTIQIRFLTITLSQLAMVAIVFLGGGQAALAATYEITQTSCMASPGGYWWAIEQANLNPGKDTIQVSTNFQVDNCTHYPSEQYPDLHVTESVDIVGNGFTVSGNVKFVSAEGNINSPGVCPLNSAGYQWINLGGGFIDIGVRNQDNQGIEVTVTGLNMQLLTGVATIRKNAKLTIANSDIKNIYSVYGGNCATPIIYADDHSDVTLTNTRFEGISVPTDSFPSIYFPVFTAAIQGFGGELVMDHVLMSRVTGRYSTSIGWYDGPVKIVSSQFAGSSGIYIDNGALDFVNSTYVTDITGGQFINNILLRKTTAKFQASTFWWGLWGDPCTGQLCAPRILGFDAVGSSIRFEGSAIGAWTLNDLPVLTGAAGQFTSDAYTWIQPRDQQDAAAIKAILPNVLTDPPGLHDVPSFAASEYLRVITPLIPGKLIETILNAQTGGANELLNPIDGTPVATDVLGNPRIYSNNTRNIGAVQNIDAPVLMATGGDAQVALGWNKPLGTITGYEICTSPTVLADPFSGLCTGTSTPVSDPTKTAETIASLTNGSPYWFVIRSVNNATPGIWSNVATATPFGPVGVPTVTAIGGLRQVQLFWSEPTTGGHPGPLSYCVVYRPLGTVQWITGPCNLSARITTIPGLTGGTTYEFGVSAQTADGAVAPVVGMATETPMPRPIPALSEWGTLLLVALTMLMLGWHIRSRGLLR